MKKRFLTFALLFASNMAFAASDQIPRDRKITETKTYSTTVMVRFTPSFTSTQGCSKGGRDWLTFSTGNDEGRALYSTILAAATANKTVGFGVSGCHSDHPKIYRVDVVY